MYVAMLDRPWLETPFVFQGFMIKDKLEIDQLQSFCTRVFVDVDKGQLTEAQIRALADGDELGQVKAAWHEAYLITPHGEPVELPNQQGEDVSA